ncbi:hypothetical protein BU25DRAFT_429541 [Macroventuria anomochaeta]|uniref:Uncharacterized protein n=1 Tax=Macroventuria anomochaeta TaxID=301207 RepID=A0ACB6S722_9PLEO|nr:uncharacterized protein BU25DRAFT_429541 [Macroventuria anomochaeta]KAF2629854.1 hypothetical protein BU25DRAFT_429541 [Macroventuria anomochaeta]
MSPSFLVQLAKLPNVEWLRERGVVRAFIAAHNQPNQFAEKSTFHIAALRAGVKYVTTVAYYPRSHWAIETMLGSPEFTSLQWTPLQPNIFMWHYLSPAVELVKKVRDGGKQVPLRLFVGADAPVGIIDPDEVGFFAALILLQEDISVHNKRKYVLNGSEDITGSQLVKMVEDHIDAKVEDVKFKDFLFLQDMVAAMPHESKNVSLSLECAAESVWVGMTSAKTTSTEELNLQRRRRRLLNILR